MNKNPLCETCPLYQHDTYEDDFGCGLGYDVIEKTIEGVDRKIWYYTSDECKLISIKTDDRDIAHLPMALLPPLDLTVVT
ncbi:MAG: hypothetical protein WAW41_14705 [Methylobacter sp.]